MKYCSPLILMLVLLFSVAGVAAGDNMTGEIDDAGSGLETDLSVKVDVKDTYQGKEYNRLGFEIPWTVNASVTGNTAYDVKVHESFSKNLEYVSHETNIGEYNPVTGIWDIGELKSTDKASLTILTKVKHEGKFTLQVNATTSSKDCDLSNNADLIPTKSGTSKFGSNTTETSDDKNQPQHDAHYASSDNTGAVTREVEGKSSTDFKNQESSDNGETEMKNKESLSDDEKISVKSSKSLIRTSSNTYNLVKSSITSAVAPTVNSDEKNSEKHVKAVAANNYTTLPLMIFALFLIVMAGIGVYDKFRG